VTDPRHLRPGEACRLLNSTPLGEVISPSQLQKHRNRAGLRIGDGRHVDLVRYVGWLVHRRHEPRPTPADETSADATLAEAAEGAAAVACRRDDGRGHGEKFSRQQEAAVAALLTEPTYAAAARKVGLSESTLYRWMQKPAFRTACQAAQRELVVGAVHRLRSGTGQAVETLLAVARKGRREGDRVRAANALLDHAFRMTSDEPNRDAAGSETPFVPADVVTLLASRLRQLDRAELPTAEKVRLTASLADAYLRAVGLDVLDKRLEAVQAVVLGRKERRP
jgi:transposase-like protein